MEILKLDASTTHISPEKYKYLKDKCKRVDLSECVNLLEIPAHMFQEWVALEEVKLPDGLLSIGDFAFIGAESLSEIKIPDSVKTIGDDVFANTGLEILELPPSLENIKEIGNIDRLKLLDMSRCRHIKTIYYSFLTGNNLNRAVFLPPEIEIIGDDAFRYVNHLIAPETLRRIGKTMYVAIYTASDKIESLAQLNGCVLNVPQELEKKYKKLFKNENLNERNLQHINGLESPWFHFYDF